MPNIPSTQNTPDAAPTDGWRLEHTYARLPQLFHAPAQPVPVSRPGWVMWNRTLAESLGLNPDSLAQPAAAAIFAGNALPTGSEPIAQAYAGHQFGHFTALGDGRAILLGEQITPSGERFDIQLKGAGATPFSRRGDGRAALGPMLREYIISEAMHALGIATTRSLAVVTTGDTVYRQQPLAGAVLTRVAASHIRVGTFEWAAARGDKDSLRALADYTLARHDPLLAEADNPYAAFLEAVVQRQAALVAQWMHVGFVHGVMNTDNMAVCGETIDYGPCAFLDAYDPATVFSSIDQHGRYAYGNQPHIAQWNLARLAESLLPLLHDDQPLAVQQATDAVGGFRQHFQHHWLKGMRSKLGLGNEETADAALADDLLGLMHTHRADFTNTFRNLCAEPFADSLLLADPAFRLWHERWRARLGRQTESLDASKRLMLSHNPAFIPRNHKVEESLAAAVNDLDFTVVQRLLDVLAKPYDGRPDRCEYQEPPPPGACPYETFCGT